jgi:hypothetical protein
MSFLLLHLAAVSSSCSLTLSTTIDFDLVRMDYQTTVVIIQPALNESSGWLMSQLIHKLLLGFSTSQFVAS